MSDNRHLAVTSVGSRAGAWANVDRGEGQGNVLAPQRHAYILERLRADGAVRVSDLMRGLDVSDMTVRRDLVTLEGQGHLVKVHGGATLLRDSAVHEPGFDTKRTREHDAKLAIARTAAAMVEPGMAVAVSAGSTTYEVSRRLAEIPRLTIVTNSVPAAEVLYHGGRRDQTIILSGGVRTPSDALVGPFAVSALRKVNVDIVFLGVHGMHERAGFTTPNMLEAETDQALIETGGRLVVTADHTKWGVTGVSTIARLDRADVIISDTALGDAARSVLEAHSGALVLAGPRGDLASGASTEGESAAVDA
jgi:DeoR/GlpR family transcriptional regulator of sugar metabolism